MLRFVSPDYLEPELFNKRTNNLLSLREQQLYYQVLNWTAAQRTEAFTFTAE